MKNATQWVESISSLVKRTEFNIQRIRDPYLRPTSSMDYSHTMNHPRNENNNIKITRDLIEIKKSIDETIENRMQNFYEVQDEVSDLYEIVQNLQSEFSSMKTGLAGGQKKFMKDIMEYLKVLPRQDEFQELQSRVDQMEQRMVEFIDKKDALLKIKSLNKKIIYLEGQLKQISVNFEDKLTTHTTNRSVNTTEIENLRLELDQKIQQNVTEVNKGFDQLNSKFQNDIQIQFKEIDSQLKSKIAKQFNQLQTQSSEIQTLLTATTQKLNQQINHLQSSIPADLEKSISNLSQICDQKATNEDFKSLSNNLHAFQQQLYQLQSKFIQLVETQPKSQPKRPQFNNQALATFGKTDHLSPIKENPLQLSEMRSSSELDMVSLNDLGPSDAESADHVSPSPSPLNRLILQHSHLLKAKKFQFDNKSSDKTPDQSNLTLGKSDWDVTTSNIDQTQVREKLEDESSWSSPFISEERGSISDRAPIEWQQEKSEAIKVEDWGFKEAEVPFIDDDVEDVKVKYQMPEDITSLQSSLEVTEESVDMEDIELPF